MSYIPHTEEELQGMLKEIGVESIHALYDEIPSSLLCHFNETLPEGLTELGVTKLIHSKLQADRTGLCFIGAGAYEHAIPAALQDLISRGEYLTAYTPYQAEASQGNLQVIYEYQTMMAHLMAMEVANASVYDGASALAESILMAVRHNKQKQKIVLIPRTVHPFYRKVVQNIVKHQNIVIEEIEYDLKSGRTLKDAFYTHENKNVAAVVVPQPNFFGVIEEVDAITDWAHAQGALVIGLVNPIAMALLKPPGQWGEKGADIACGEGQPLGVPLSSGGPYFGFMACQLPYVRQMPGRIVGRTVDREGKPGFVLTLQAREQHIRRSKATSNICTNQGLMVTAATIYMSLLGPKGLYQVAAASHVYANNLFKLLMAIPTIETVFSPPFFHEFVIRFEKPVSMVLKHCVQNNIQAGYDLSKDYPELGNCLLVCVTETKTAEDLLAYQNALQGVLSSMREKTIC